MDFPWGVRGRRGGGGARGERGKDIAMHLLNLDLLPTKDLPPLRRQRHRTDAEFPAAVVAGAPRDLPAERAADDLMPVADAESADAGVGEEGGGEGEEGEDPGCGVEGVVACFL